MAKRKAKPKSPEQIALEKRRDRRNSFVALNMLEEAADLSANQDVMVEREVRPGHGERGNIDRARRLDAFDALAYKNRKPSDDKVTVYLDTAAYNAARQLERDMRIFRGEADRGKSSIHVDVDPTKGDFDDARKAAGYRVRDALKKVGDRDAKLLSELIYPTVERDHWRKTVEYVTGETHSHAQAAVVRSACANLAAAYSRRQVAA